MAQSIFGGATEYGEQSLEDIFEDIGYWIDYSKIIKILLSNGMSDSKKSGFWKKIDNEFQMTIETSIGFINTILYDLHEIVRSKENGCITNKEVTLLSNIGRKSIQYNNEYGRNYKAEKRLWHDYGNPDFKVVENMYSKGRDFFVTLQDALNASYRMEDYMQNGNTTNVSINGNVSDSQIQIGTVNSNQYNSVNDNVPYEELNIFIDEIEKYRSILSADLKENGEKFCEVLDNLTHEIKNNGSYSKIKNGLETIKSFMTGMASSIAASGVLALLKNINF